MKVIQEHSRPGVPNAVQMSSGALTPLLSPGPLALPKQMTDTHDGNGKLLGAYLVMNQDIYD